jgi:hypothetical protein
MSTKEPRSVTKNLPVRMEEEHLRMLIILKLIASGRLTKGEIECSAADVVRQVEEP